MLEAAKKKKRSSDIRVESWIVVTNDLPKRYETDIHKDDINVLNEFIKSENLEKESQLNSWSKLVVYNSKSFKRYYLKKTYKEEWISSFRKLYRIFSI